MAITARSLVNPKLAFLIVSFCLGELGKFIFFMINESCEFLTCFNDIDVSMLFFSFHIYHISSEIGDGLNIFQVKFSVL